MVFRAQGLHFKKGIRAERPSLGSRFPMWILRVSGAIGALGMCLVCTSCLLPPEGVVLTVDQNYPPTPDRDSLRPSTPRITIDPAMCRRFRVAAELTDIDDDELLVRWVVNNKDNDAKIINAEDDEVPLVGANRGVRISIRPDVVFDFDRVDPDETGADVLSAFVTDAPGWAEEVPGLDVDLGRPADTELDAGPTDRWVTELRWTIEYDKPAPNPDEADCR